MAMRLAIAALLVSVCVASAVEDTIDDEQLALFQQRTPSAEELLQTIRTMEGDDYAQSLVLLTDYNHASKMLESDGESDKLITMRTGSRKGKFLHRIKHFAKNTWQKVKGGAFSAAISKIVDKFLVPHIGELAEKLNGKFSCDWLLSVAVPKIEESVSKYHWLKLAWGTVHKKFKNVFKDKVCSPVVKKVCNKVDTIKAQVEKSGGAASLKAFNTLADSMCTKGAPASSSLVEEWQEAEEHTYGYD